jgi:hypothetical protein
VKETRKSKRDVNSKYLMQIKMFLLFFPVEEKSPCSLRTVSSCTSFLHTWLLWQRDGVSAVLCLLVSYPPALPVSINEHFLLLSMVTWSIFARMLTSECHSIQALNACWILPSSVKKTQVHCVDSNFLERSIGYLMPDVLS